MSYADVQRKTREKMGEGDAPNNAPCIRCTEPASRADLSQYGGRCLRCYEAYCRVPVAQFNARFKTGEPKLALPRREVEIAPGHIGEHLAKRPTRDEVAGYAAELGIDVDEQEA